VTRHTLAVDRSVSLQEDHSNSHNRWHPAITPVLTIRPGDEVTFSCRDGYDGQVRDGDGADALGRLEMGREHPLTGPVYVEGAEPGDLLEVEILDIATDPYGFSAVFAGFSRLRERFTESRISHWSLAGGVARSPQIPGVAFTARPFLGVIGVAPSAERVAAFAAREQALADAGSMLPLPLADFVVPADPRIATEGLRTLPPRENGGNWDVPDFSLGSTVLLPVEVPGALLSVGDPHFRQGDGEVSGAAIETSAEATLRVSLVKADDAVWHPRTPAASVRRPAQPATDWMVTTGIPVTPEGANRDEDLMLAADHALGEMVDRLVAERGYEPWQAFTILSIAVELRVTMIVVPPNCTVSAALPLDIFE
jgi:formamidase